MGNFQWIPFYEALADKLLTYNDKRDELFDLIKKTASEHPLMNYLHFDDREEWWGDHHIDPFSVIGIFNRDTKDANRTDLARVLADKFDIDLDVPTQFAGIPVLNNRNSFYSGRDDVFDLFVLAIETAKTGNLCADFRNAFDKALAAKGNGLAYITMGLYWIRPNFYMPLDGNSCSYISAKYGITAPSGKNCGNEYISFLKTLKAKVAEQSPNLTLPEISYKAWTEKGGEELPPKNDDDTSKPADKNQTTTATKKRDFKMEKNIILYGTPGTGKTYSTVQYAVSIIEEKSLETIKSENYDSVFERYEKYSADGLIAFTTFHQSYCYEEFIEGIRPVVDAEQKSETGREIAYEIRDGVFKEFCDKAGMPIGNNANVDFGLRKNPTIWKVSLEHTGDNPTRTECLKNNHIRIGWDDYGDTISDTTDYSNNGGSGIMNAFYNRMQIGDIVFSCFSQETIDAIGVITGEPEWHEEYDHYKRLRKVKWLASGFRKDIVNVNAGKVMTLSTVYKLSVSVSDALDLLREVKPELFASEMKIPNRVFIIDEINRGNVSKIFGELITLIEPSKRIGASEQRRAILPYSGQNFGIPQNVYIIGTMNTADRSIALIDTALRRRFDFVEMLPESSVLADIHVDNDISIAEMLDTINKRITVLLDREHTIGHSYFFPLKDEPTLEMLAKIFKGKIIPLLQEYFYDDYAKIQLVLGDNQKQDENSQFIIKKNDSTKLFGNTESDYSSYYEINNEAFTRIDSYAYMRQDQNNN